MTLVTLAVLVNCKSACVTVTVAVEGGGGVGSGVVLVTWATLAIAPEAVLAACTVKVMVANVLEARLATVPVTALVLVLKLRPLALALTRLTPAGSASVTVTFCAALGPALKTTMV